ncbi:patatin-like phospholipase domain-containing protein 7 [Gigantopelta aegis]|uniref:patatin-like phospholipase domain-containing protein 7 n=1 Tax=Gigantopelta aegis TaxID=1735272 RepID=UPI001B887A85|nr:patatin-like phospholipase domain-containing protein 7 [Gigantopelta aegis]
MDFVANVGQVLQNLSQFQGIMITVVVGVITVLALLFFGILKFKTKVLPSRNESENKYRFRKREKLMFYGRKMLRKVRSFTRNTIGNGQSFGRRKYSSKQMVNRLKRFLQRRKESSPQLRVKEPPQSFLEADWSDIEEMDSRLPPEVLYMLRSVRVFGHLEKPFFLELCKFMESMVVRAGNFLFKIGDLDDSIYVLQSGCVNVFITEQDGSQHLVKEVNTGDSIHSLLSILDVLTGHPAPYKTVSARAEVDSIILRLPAHAFRSMFERFPESTVRVVQIIMIRLQRVTFMALHNYLGLSSELIKSQKPRTKKLPSDQLMKSQGSPLKMHHYSSYTADDIFIDSEARRGSHFRDPSEQSRSKVSVGTEVRLSDFDTACMRARVPPQEHSSSSGKANQQQQEAKNTKGNEESQSSVLGSKRPKRSNENISQLSNCSPEQRLEVAQRDLIEVLGLKNPKLLEARIHMKEVKAGSILCEQGQQDASLIFVVTGSLQKLQQVVGEENREAIVFTANPGDIVGSLAVLTGEPSLFTIRCKTDAIVLSMSKLEFYSIMSEEPNIVLNVAHTTVRRMTPFVRQIDFALDWQMADAGKAIFRQGDDSECIFIVLTGRLRSVITRTGGKKELVGEYGRGELVGIVEVLTQTERATTVMAVRDTELAKMPSGLLNLIKRKYPYIVTRLIHLLGQRILGSLQNQNTVNLGTRIAEKPNVENLALTANLATVAVLPVSDDVPLMNFTLELQHALLAIGTTTRLTSEIIKKRMGNAALDSVNEFRLFSWLGQQEDIHRMVLYQCDMTLTKWTKNCIRQADCILIVGLAENEPTVGEIEKQLERIAVRAQKELVLLHRQDSDKPRNTVEWLNSRGWCSSHHHIRCPPRVFSKRPVAKQREVYEKLFEMKPDRFSDFSRLARFLTGTSIGLVLGGGGARGLAHVGMIKAIIEAGIPIDMVGGTSMGSFIGALWCEERNFPRFIQRAREWAIGMKSLWKTVMDMTYPITSMFTGGAFNACIECVFQDTQIEDLWIPYFCITTDITNSSMRVHTSGNLWRYVRASMSLSGYLPPLCDPIDGHLLLDGGYVNNLPADVCREMGAQTVLAVDVGSQDQTSLTNYGDKISGWWLLWKRFNPWAEPVRVPDMTEIQARLAYVSCVKMLDVVKNSDYCEYVRPPIDKYGTLQFGSYDEIAEVGYNHGKTLFQGWHKGGVIEKLFTERAKDIGIKTNQKQAQVPVMAYFTDLAELVSKIDKPKPRFYLHNDDFSTDSDDEYEEVEETDEEADHIVYDHPDDEDVNTVGSNPESTFSSDQHTEPIVGTSKMEPVGSRRRNRPLTD